MLIDPYFKHNAGPWELFYNGWDSDGTYRRVTKKYGMFPNSREGSLETEMPLKLGLTRSRMLGGYALWLYQLFLTMCDPAKLDIKDNLRKTLYTEVERFVNVYSIECGIASP